MLNLFERRFVGVSRLYGLDSAQKIAAAHIAVIGIGGVGSWTAEALARCGVGQLTLVDMDHVAESNINRQIHATESTLGQSKVEAMCQRIVSINPACRVHALDDFVTPQNWPGLLPDSAQVVVDACDHFPAKWAMADWALSSSRPLVICGAAGGKTWPHKVDLADLSEVTHDPLLSRLRYQLRKAQKAPRVGRIGLQCVFSREAVAPVHESCSMAAAGGRLNCHGYGSAVMLTSTLGMTAATAAIHRAIHDI